MDFLGFDFTPTGVVVALGAGVAVGAAVPDGTGVGVAVETPSAYSAEISPADSARFQIAAF